MNNRENDDELERMRARARRGSGRQDGGRQSSRVYPRPVQPAGERRSARQSYDGREEYIRREGSDRLTCSFGAHSFKSSSSSSSWLWSEVDRLERLSSS